ncbi:MAG: cytochrome C, partial [Desulfovibrio sp.]|nr:cytochrome C [Desulfovibrio sp.]
TMKCAGCHDREPAKLVPGRMEANHKLCMDCHDGGKKGPGKKAPCTQCHLK